MCPDLPSTKKAFEISFFRPGTRATNWRKKIVAKNFQNLENNLDKVNKAEIIDDKNDEILLEEYNNSKEPQAVQKINNQKTIQI